MWFHSEHESFGQTTLTGSGVKVRSGRWCLGCGFGGYSLEVKGRQPREQMGDNVNMQIVSVRAMAHLVANLHSHMFRRSLCIV